MVYDTQFYVVTKPALFIPVDKFILLPYQDNAIILYSVTLANGTSLPSFITFVETGLTIEIKVLSYTNLDTGDF